MIEAPFITQSAAVDMALIHLTIPREQIREVMYPAMQEVLAAVTSQGIATGGPLFTHHLKMHPDIFDVEVCAPVKAPVQPVGRVKPGHLAATQIARTVYHGDYEDLGDAWGEFMDWIEANGYTPATDLWECYTVGPESSPNPADWRTELNRPVSRPH